MRIVEAEHDLGRGGELAGSGAGHLVLALCPLGFTANFSDLFVDLFKQRLALDELTVALTVLSSVSRAGAIPLELCTGAGCTGGIAHGLVLIQEERLRVPFCGRAIPA